MVCGAGDGEEEKIGKGFGAECRGDTESAELRRKQSGKIVGKSLSDLRDTCVPPSQPKKLSDHILPLKNLEYFSV